MSKSHPTAARRLGIVRTLSRAVLRLVWGTLRVLMIMMAAVGPAPPPPPPPRPAPIEARAEVEGEDEEP